MSTKILKYDFKKSLTIISVVILILASNQLFAQSQKEIVNIFKAKVDGLQNCISKEEWLMIDIKYDVKKTESLIASIQGEINFKVIKSGLVGNSYATYPVILKLYWSEDEKKWIIEKLLSKSLGFGAEQPWTEPGKDNGWNFASKPGFAMEDLINALRKHFSGN